MALTRVILHYKARSGTRCLAVLALSMLMLGLLSVRLISTSFTGPVSALMEPVSRAKGFVSVEGHWIVDASYRPILLRGVNYIGYHYEGPKPHTEQDYREFARLGFNVVRVPISWANIEQEPAVFETSYVTRYLDQDIKWAKQYGMYVILDMHQWKWASRFGGAGAPDWTVRQYDPTEAGMGEAAANFWLNSTLQDHLIQVWREIARIHADESTIAGYDLLNEPWAIGQSVIPHLNATNVEKFYLNAIRAIRAVDSNHIIFLEPPRISAFTLPLNDKNIVYSPHFYPLSFFSRYVPGNEEVLEADLAAKYTNFVLESGRPIWIGEFGAFMQDGSYVNWLRDAIGIFNKYQIGWAWWGVSPGQEIPSVLFQSTAS